MRFEIFYEGLLGKVSFTEHPVSYKTHDFSDYSRDYNLVNRSIGFGSIINKFLRNAVERSITINVVGSNMYEVLNDMTQVFSYDMEKLSPGKLWVNDSYLVGYFLKANDANWELAGNAIETTLTFLALDPIWQKEREFNFSIYDTSSSNKGFKLPMRFPMHFVSTLTVPIVKNINGMNNLAKMTFFGPVTDPRITIENQSYQVFGELLDNERYVIDQRRKTVEKITASGDVVNSFHLRQKTPSVFTALPEGEHVLVYNRSFSVQIIIFEGSVEPAWK